MSVVHIGDFSVARKARTYHADKDKCLHKQVELDPHGEVVKCLKCDVQVSAWWFLRMLTDEWERLVSERDRQAAAVAEAKAANIHLLAARKAEKAWRSKRMVPSCPHCHRGILPEDGFGGSTVNRDMELRRRAAERAKP